MNAALRKWVPALAPALLVLLLGVQVFLGARGFQHPSSGPLGALELPGRLLGWGGVALLLPLLVWLLLGWWGFDVTGMALKTLGALTLGLAVGGLSSLWGSEPQGGAIGGPLGTLLGEVLGGFIASLLLLMMVIPGVLLASARFQLGPRSSSDSNGGGAGGPRPKNAPSLKRPGAAPSLTRAPGPPRPQGWYPEKRYDAQGNELPMDFGGSSDVGSIRFRDQPGGTSGDAPPAPAAAPAPAPSAQAATEPEPAPSPHSSSQPAARQKGPGGWPQGLVSDAEALEPETDDEDEDEDASDEDDVGPVHVKDERSESGASQRAKAERAKEQRAAAGPVRPAPAPAPQRPPPPPPPPEKVFARQLFPKNAGDAVLLPGVRYRDEPPLSPPQAAPPAAIEPEPEPDVTPAEEALAHAPTAPPPTAPTAQRTTRAPKPAPAPAPAKKSEPPPAKATQAPKPTQAASSRKPAPPPEPDELDEPLDDDASPLGPPSVPYVRPAAAADEPESVSRILEPLGDTAAMARYRKKLEASGIFANTEGGEAPAVEPPPSAPPSAPKQAPPSTQAPSTQAEAQAAARARIKAVADERRKSAPLPQPAPPEPPPPAKASKAKAAKPQRAETGKLFDTDEPPGREQPAQKPETARAVTEKAPAAEKPSARPAAPRPRGAWVAELEDASFLQAVEAALERGSASPVLLTRRLGVGYAKAQALVERLALTGVLGDVGPNGSRPVLIRAQDVEAARLKPS